MGSAPYIPIQIVDLDSDNDGVIGGPDVLAYAAAHGSTKGDPNYDRQFDANFDDDIDSDDEAIFVATYGGINDLGVIRDAIKTNTVQKLIWPDDWAAWLVAVEENYIIGFTGRDGYSPPGWISVHRHPYLGAPYHCAHFSLDTALASYKGLGYGCILQARSDPAGIYHFYNIFWVGGDWTKLENWYILEPQSGSGIINAATPTLGEMYHTKKITFYAYTALDDWGYPYLNGYDLIVDFEAKTVSYGAQDVSAGHGQPVTQEEPIAYPYNFDRTLGIPSVIPTVTTQPASSIEQTSAIGNGTIVDTGGEDCDQRGAEWGLSSGNYYASSVGSGSFSAGSFTKLMQGLSAETTYYYRAKAHNTAGWGYGNEVSFVTLTADADKIAYDAGSGVENISDRAIIRAETGEGAESYKRKIIAETASLIATYSRDEVGSGLDALLDRYTGGIDTFGADSGSGVGSYKRSKLGEISRLLAIITKDDAGSGAGVSAEGRVSDDAGIGTEALLNRLLALHEEGIATDEIAQLIIVVTAITSSDSGIGEDVLRQLEASRDIISPGDLRDIVTATKRAIATASKRNIVSPTKRDIVSSGDLRRIK